MMQFIYVVDAAILIALSLVAAAFLYAACRRRSSIWGEILDRAFNFFLIVCWLVINGRHPLSLDFFEIVALMAPLALSIGGWPLRSALYYGAILLAIQTVWIPRFDLGPLQFGFWMHGVGHIGIFTAVGYDLLVNRYRPRWTDWGFASAAIFLYEIALMPVDLPIKANHRLLILIVFAIMTVPWQLARRERKMRPVVPVAEVDEDTELVYSA